MNGCQPDEFFGSPDATVESKVRGLIERARRQAITTIEFRGALKSLSIQGSRRKFYTQNAFGLTLEEAKRIAVNVEHGPY